MSHYYLYETLKTPSASSRSLCGTCGNWIMQKIEIVVNFFQIKNVKWMLNRWIRYIYWNCLIEDIGLVNKISISMSLSDTISQTWTFLQYKNETIIREYWYEYIPNSICTDVLMSYFCCMSHIFKRIIVNISSELKDS